MLVSLYFLTGPAASSLRHQIARASLPTPSIGTRLTLEASPSTLGQILQRTGEIRSYLTTIAKSNQPTDQTPTVAAKLSLTPSPKPSPQPRPSATPKPSGAKTANRLVISSIGVDMPITEGLDGKTALRQGIWRMPLPGDPTPDHAGDNVVFAGHRWYRQTGPNTLYRLNLIKTGDSMVVYWKGSEYTYTVAEVKIVDPKQLEILEDTDESQITIFTCTPLYSSKYRLVVIAKPITP